jgi:hypothetical protein
MTGVVNVAAGTGGGGGVQGLEEEAVVGAAVATVPELACNCRSASLWVRSGALYSRVSTRRDGGMSPRELQSLYCRPAAKRLRHNARSW